MLFDKLLRKDVILTNNYESVWERLEKKPNFMKAYNDYNAKSGHAFVKLKEQKHDIQGRSVESKLLVDIMERNLTPVAALIGQAGVGKSALVEDFIKRVGRGEIKSVPGREYCVISLRIGNLKALGNDKLQSIISNMLNDIKKLEDLAIKELNNNKIRFILFIDEFHMLVTIFGPNTKIGGDLMKDVLARTPIRVIAATTRKEFDSTIAVDEPFKERFKEIELNELPKYVILDICKNWWKKHVPKLPMPNDELFNKIIDANAAYRAQQAEPRKSLDILEDLVAKIRISRRAINEETIDSIFKNRFHINLTLDFDADGIFDNVKKHVIGQSMALYELKRALRGVAFQLDKNPNKPIMTLLFSGPTGVGKTETTKAICEVLYPGENVLQTFNMPDYKLNDLEPAFRKKLGETVRHQPNSVILLDEFEKGSQAIQDAMLAILDEGIVNFEVTNREGQKEVHFVSLRNTIIIATTNAGHQIFQNYAEFATDNNGFEVNSKTRELYEQLRKSLEASLKQNGFKPEMLGRFDRIIPYRNLTEDVMIKISDLIINSYFKKLKNLKGIKVEQKPKQTYFVNGKNGQYSDLSTYISKFRASSTDSTAGGARALKRAIKADIEDALIDKICDNPGKKHFKIYVSEKSRLYVSGASDTEGGIVIDVLD